MSDDPAEATAPSQPLKPAKPEPLGLPQPRHLPRLPPHLQPADIKRIQQAAYQLPQVVNPVDDLDDRSAGSEDHFEQLGYVMLQKAVSGARPSRWIAPALMDEALQHLDATGQTQKARATLLERTAALEALGVVRLRGEWTRTIMQPLVLSRPGWKVSVASRRPIDDKPVWAFYRTGDATQLLSALGPPPQMPEARQLAEHLEALVARSVDGHPRQIDSLLPRLQAEAATPHSIDELLRAFTRAQDRWEHRAAEMDALVGLTDELAFQGYPDSFPLARRLQRSITLFVGPPNSGKTHAAFERLAQATHGVYLAPLRLLALEGRDRLVARGVPCSLLTGEENVPADGARVVSSTIEMIGTNRAVDVAVIDEAQMIFDASRGWAWTQAIVGAPADEVIIICSAHAVVAIRNLLGLCGERCDERVFERKQHVDLLPQPVPLKSLVRGDAVVAFSRRDVLGLRDRIAADGHAVSVIYGALPPEVRRREAERFAQGLTDVLVATDAIGMGLNLPIRRVLFSTLVKFDGVGDRPLDESEVHQIAGRAGRFGIHEEGFTGVLSDAEPTALRSLRDLLPKVPRAPVDFKAPVAPGWWHIETIAARLHRTKLREVLGVFVDQLRLDNAHFAVAQLEQMLMLAEQLDEHAGRLSLKQRFVYAQAPVDTRADTQVQAYLSWAASHAFTGKAGTPWFLSEVDGHSRLDRMEQALRACTLWLWLDLRFSGVYGQVEQVIALREALNDGIERQLQGKRPLGMRPGGRPGQGHGGPRPRRG